MTLLDDLKKTAEAADHHVTITKETAHAYFKNGKAWVITGHEGPSLMAGYIWADWLIEKLRDG